MANYVKVKNMLFLTLFKSIKFDRLVNGIIRCCTGFMWNNTIGDCTGTKGFLYKIYSPRLNPYM